MILLLFAVAVALAVIAAEWLTRPRPGRHHREQTFRLPHLARAYEAQHQQVRERAEPRHAHARRAVVA